ncbi:unnamed protein product [Rhizoctonia solani]|uniref:Uncharacterized protein n=1 Tax=Rhizoctonia solani TaxID=456999 RepID=A0A8H3GL33_9AGAM|nr:unnamed protein product [Rhizoctonia solani]
MSSSQVNYNADPLSYSPTPTPAMDLIARHGMDGGPVLHQPVSLEGYLIREIHEEFYERFPVSPLSMGYTRIHPIPRGDSEEADTRADSPLPWRDLVASNAPNGWGADAPLWGVLNLEEGMNDDWRGYTPSLTSSTSTTERKWMNGVSSLLMRRSIWNHKPHKPL